MLSSLRFSRLEFSRVPWDKLDNFADRTVFQTREWVQFIAATQEATPIIGELRNGRAVVGYFTGLTIQKLGIRILGSSFPGWTTPYIGFNLQPGVSRHSALDALQDWAFGELKCLHIEVSDPHFVVEDGATLGFTVGTYAYSTDLTCPEEELFESLPPAQNHLVSVLPPLRPRLIHVCHKMDAVILRHFPASAYYATVRVIKLIK